MNTLFMRSFALLLFAAATTATLHAQIPQLINYQGRVAVGMVNFDGAGQFKFALINAAGSTASWSNAGSVSLTPDAITPASEPTAPVSGSNPSEPAVNTKSFIRTVGALGFLLTASLPAEPRSSTGYSITTNRNRLGVFPGLTPSDAVSDGQTSSAFRELRPCQAGSDEKRPKTSQIDSLKELV